MKEQLQELIAQHKSIREIATEVGKSPTTVRYWLAKFELKTNSKSTEIRPTDTTRVCPMCKIEKELNEYHNRRDKQGTSVYCKPCTAIQTIKRQQAFKLSCIMYKGSQCQLCKYSTYQGALEFHHLDPTQKDFHMGQVKLYKFDETIKKELDKCVLLCANCHRETHAGLTSLSNLTTKSG